MRRLTIGQVVGGTLAAIALSVGTIAALRHVHAIDADIPTTLRRLPIGMVLTLFGLLFAAWIADALRLREVAAALGVSLPMRLALGAVLAGNFSINITPFYVGAGLVHIYVLHRRGLDLARATAAIAGGGVISHFT